MTDHTVPLLDLAQIADLAALDQGRGALLTRFVDLFVAGTGERIDRIRRHAEVGRSGRSRRGGACAEGGRRECRRGAPCASVLERIEVAAIGRDLGAAGAAVALLDAEYAAARTALLAATGRSGA